MKLILLSLVIAILVPVASLFINPTHVSALTNCDVSAADLAIVPEEVELLRLINEYRTQNGLGTLAISPSLQRASSFISRDMATSPYYFSHTDRYGRTPGTRMTECGFDNPYTWRGENLAAGQGTPEDAMIAWKGSPGHNALMLDPKYVAIGIGFVRNPSAPYVSYWSLDVASDFGFTENPNPSPSPIIIPPSPASSPIVASAAPSPSPTPTPPPTPIPSPAVTLAPPTIEVNVSCINLGYNGSGINFSWINPSSKVTSVNISSNPNFTTYFQKSVGTLLVSTTTAPSGFMNGGTKLALNPNTTYYVRLWNGTHSGSANFTVPACSQSSPTPTPPSNAPSSIPSLAPSPSPIVVSGCDFGANQLIGCIYDGTNFNSLIGATMAGPTLSVPVPDSTTALNINYDVNLPPGQTGNDTFSSRWKGNLTFKEGTYRFTAGSDDGVRVKIGGTLKLNKWVNRPYTEDSFNLTFPSSVTIPVEIEYYDNYGKANLKFYWVKI